MVKRVKRTWEKRNKKENGRCERSSMNSDKNWWINNKGERRNKYELRKK